jgi:leader peptidase (prepilin peptidase)/N-methyltransferase
MITATHNAFLYVFQFLMIEFIPFILLIIACILLVTMSAIDLKYWILPDELNAALAVCGIAFHILTAYSYVEPADMAIGAAIGAGLLYIIRFFANKHYDRDTLGLGDVKLLGAAGLWLGVEGILQAITLGAFAGLLHGILYAAVIAVKNKTRFSISQLSIPAGPGFAVGIMAAGWMIFGDYILTFFEKGSS